MCGFVQLEQFSSVPLFSIIITKSVTFNMASMRPSNNTGGYGVHSAGTANNSASAAQRKYSQATMSKKRPLGTDESGADAANVFQRTTDEPQTPQANRSMGYAQRYAKNGGGSFG